MDVSPLTGFEVCPQFFKELSGDTWLVKVEWNHGATRIDKMEVSAFALGWEMCVENIRAIIK